MNVAPPETSGRELASAGRGALVYGAAFTVFRDVLQFLTMLVLVRLLTPSQYGQMALAQAVIGVLSIVTFRTFLSHALQVADPSTIDWQSHFSMGLLLNSAAFLLTIFVAAGLYATDAYHDAAMPLCLLALVFLVEVPASLRHTMLQVAHDWRRFRVLTIAGALAGSVSALVIAALGGGVAALVAPVILFGVPAVIDLFLVEKWRPDFTLCWRKYRDIFRFGMTRIGSGGALAVRNASEGAALASQFDLGLLGVFSRSIGLATLAAGRVGAVTLASLYPVITRAESRSDRFRRIAGLVLRAVTWITITAAIFVSLVSDNLVAIVYGPRWLPVAQLLPFAAVYVAISGIAGAATSLLLANQESGASMRIDIAFSSIGLLVIFLAVPVGVTTYLVAMTVLSSLSAVVSLALLFRCGGIDGSAFKGVFIPPVCASVAAVAAVYLVRGLRSPGAGSFGGIAVDSVAFWLVWITTIRVFFTRSLADLLVIAPAGRVISRLLLLNPLKGSAG